MLEAGVCLRATARWSGNQIEVVGDIQYNTQGGCCSALVYYKLGVLGTKLSKMGVKLVPNWDREHPNLSFRISVLFW